MNEPNRRKFFVGGVIATIGAMANASSAAAQNDAPARLLHPTSLVNRIRGDRKQLIRRTKQVLAAIGVVFALCWTSAEAASRPSQLDEIRAFQQSTNEGRFAALSTLLHTYKLPYVIEPFNGGTKTARRAGRNVIVTILGRGKTIILSAHYDAHSVEGGRLAPGAVDNAAAVVELVHIANAMKHRHLAHQVKFVFFDQEEIGRVGSTAYASAHRSSETAAAINVDIAGYGDTLIYSEPHTAVGVTLINQTRKLCALRGLNCIGYPTFPISDEVSMAEAGVPAIGLAILTRLEAHQLWLILNSGDPEHMGPVIGPNVKLMRIMHMSGDTVDKVDPATITLGEAFFSDYLLAVDKAITETPK